MNIQKIIEARKLEMVNQSHDLGQKQAVLNNQLQQINALIARLNIELDILLEWETRLKGDKKCLAQV